MLVDQLVEDFHQDKMKVSTSISEIRLNGKLHIIRKGVKRDCVVCYKRKEKDVKRQTSDYCDTYPSKQRMHMGDCFQSITTWRTTKLKICFTYTRKINIYKINNI